MGFLEEVNALTALDTPRKPGSTRDIQAAPDIAFAGDILCFFEESQRLADFINVSEIHVLANSKDAFALWHAKFLRACEQADSILAHAANVYASGSYPSVFPRLGATKRSALDTIGVLMHRIGVANEFDSLSSSMLLEMEAELDACGSLLCELQELQCSVFDSGTVSETEECHASTEKLRPILGKLQLRIIPLSRRMQFMHMRVQSLLDRSSAHFPEAQAKIETRFKNIQARLTEISTETDSIGAVLGDGVPSNDLNFKNTYSKTKTRLMGLRLASPPSTRKSIVPLRGLRVRSDRNAPCPLMPDLPQASAPPPITPVTTHRRMRSLSSGTEESYAPTEASTESPFSSPETLMDSDNMKLLGLGHQIQPTITSTPLSAAPRVLEEAIDLDKPPVVPTVPCERHQPAKFERLSRVEEETDSGDGFPNRPPSRIKPPTALRPKTSLSLITPTHRLTNSRPLSSLARMETLPKPTPLSTYNRLSQQQPKRSTSSLQKPTEVQPRLRSRTSMIPVANSKMPNKSASAIARQSGIPTVSNVPALHRLAPRQSMPAFHGSAGDYETPTRRHIDTLGMGSSLRVRPRQSMQF